MHDQNHPLFGIPLHEQLFQETDKGGAVLGQGSCPGDGVFQPVVTAKDMAFLLCTWMGGWNPSLLSSLHPARPQRRIQRYGCFVHKEECEIVSDGFFFNSSRLWCINRFFEDAIPNFGSFLVISTILVGEICQNFAENQP